MSKTSTASAQKWTFVPEETGCPVVNEFGSRICDMDCCEGQPMETMEANARLIAAAPELLEACVFLLDKIQFSAKECGGGKEMFEFFDGDWRAMEEKLLEAITKAEGRA